MRTVETASYPVQIFIAGSYLEAETLCRAYCDGVGLCVTVTPTEYVYSGGQEAGVIVGLINYGRFPSDPDALFERAKQLALYLIKQLAQESASIQAPDTTLWLSFRPDDLAPIEARRVETPKDGSMRSTKAGNSSKTDSGSSVTVRGE